MIVSVGTAFDTFSRFALAFLSLFVKIKARHIFLTGAVVLLFLRFGMIVKNVQNHGCYFDYIISISFSIFVHLQF